MKEGKKHRQDGTMRKEKVFGREGKGEEEDGCRKDMGGRYSLSYGHDGGVMGKKEGGKEGVS